MKCLVIVFLINFSMSAMEEGKFIEEVLDKWIEKTGPQLSIKELMTQELKSVTNQQANFDTNPPATILSSFVSEKDGISEKADLKKITQTILKDPRIGNLNPIYVENLILFRCYFSIVKSEGKIKENVSFFAVLVYRQQTINAINNNEPQYKQHKAKYNLLLSIIDDYLKAVSTPPLVKSNV